MKVLFPVSKVSFTSQNISNSNCTTYQPADSFKSKSNTGISNQEIYESIITLKNNITSFFSRTRREENNIDYKA